MTSYKDQHGISRSFETEKSDRTQRAKHSPEEQENVDGSCYVLAQDEVGMIQEAHIPHIGNNISMISQNTFDDEISIDSFADRPPRYPMNLSKWNKTWSGRIVNGALFKKIVIGLIMTNSALMCIGTFDFVTENPRALEIFQVLEVFFLVTFSIEIALKMLYHQFTIFTNSWITFDFVVVVLAWIFPPLMVIRTFRIVRTMRLINRVKSLKFVVKAMLRVIPKMMAIIFILVVIFFTFAVMFTDMFKSLYDEGLTDEDYFSRLDKTAFTLFHIMTLDNWSRVTDQIMKTHEWAWVPFISFIMITSYGFLNIIVAVLCESVSSVQREQHMKAIEDIHENMISPSKRTKMAVKRMENKIDALVTSVEFLVDLQAVDFRTHPPSQTLKSQFTNSSDTEARDSDRRKDVIQ